MLNLESASGDQEASLTVPIEGAKFHSTDLPGYVGSVCSPAASIGQAARCWILETATWRVLLSIRPTAAHGDWRTGRILGTAWTGAATSRRFGNILSPERRLRRIPDACAGRNRWSRTSFGIGSVSPLDGSRDENAARRHVNHERCRHVGVGRRRGAKTADWTRTSLWTINWRTG